MYKHGIEVNEKATSFPSPLSTRYGVQVIFGTAPVNLADDPYNACNRPIRVTSFEEAQAALGYSEDWEHYTLCQSMYASFQLFQIYPVVFVNVLDPNRHYKAIGPEVHMVENHQITLEDTGIILSDLVLTMAADESQVGEARVGEAVVAAGEQTLKPDQDYIAAFNDQGQVVITLLTRGDAYYKSEITVTAKAIDPEAVTERDLIGAYDVETGVESGLEVLRRVYPMYGLVPGALMAPGWTENPNIGAALQGKCEEISGAFSCVCLLDLDTDQARKYTDCLGLKNEMGYDEAHSIVLWPQLTANGKTFRYSAVYGAMMSYNTAVNEDVPYLYPSNKALNVDGAVLADGTEVFLDQVQAGAVNGDGIVTAFRDTEWKSYGNNTGCYPDNTDPKDRWIACRRMFDFVGNYFVAEYRARLDENMNRRTVDDIVNSFNIWGNSLVASGMCAGLYAEFRSEDNTVDDILAGHIKVRIYFAPYTPAEYICATMEFDMKALEAAMSGEE